MKNPKGASSVVSGTCPVTRKDEVPRVRRTFLPLVSGQRYAYLGYGCLSCLAQTLPLVRMEDLAGRLGDFTTCYAWMIVTKRWI